MRNYSIILLIAVFCAAFQTAAISEKQIYTGLIVDARELKVDPSKSPKVFDTAGREIYGTMDVNPDYVEKVGIVRYENTIGDAIRNETAGVNPIVVRAIRRGPHPFKSDVIISADDGNWVIRSNKRSLFLEKLEVVFII